MLKEWINSKYLDPKKITLTKKPFPHLELKNFFKENKLLPIIKSLTKQKFFLKDSDLFTFFQTNDLKTTNDKSLKEFRQFLTSKEFREYLEEITKLKLKQNIDLFATIYQDTNYLLPHDDRLESRKIAFFIYLSNLTKKDGGSLNFYKNNKINKTLVPKFNTFTFFLVSKKSLHEVKEVISNKQRITLTGWYHD